MSQTPEHDCRDALPGHPLDEEVIAAYNYVAGGPCWDGVKNGGGYWHGWAIREAFLAGITYARQHEAKK